MFFVRDGIAVQGGKTASIILSGGQGRTVEWKRGGKNEHAEMYGKETIFIRMPWRFGDRFHIEVTHGGGKFTKFLQAPEKPSPLCVAVVDLERITPRNADDFSPDTNVAFSPDGNHLAIGSFFGYLRIFDISAGEIVFKKKVAEGMVKRIVWGEVNGKPVLYVGEQSPDGFIYCMEAETGRTLWKYRLADDLETSSASEEADDRFSIYNFPGVYQLRVLQDGDVVVAGTHGWFRGDDYVSKCAVYRFDGATGRRKWRWPEKETLPYRLVWFGVSKTRNRLALLSGGNWRGQKIASAFKDGTLYCLDSDSGQITWEYRVPPLSPYYDAADSWQGVAVSPDGKYVVLGLNDGRGMLFDAEPKTPPAVRPLWIKHLGTPLSVGGIPVAASVTYVGAGNEDVYFVLPGTTIPTNTGNSMTRRPAPHPRAGHLFACDHNGRLKWMWKAVGSPQGVFLSRDGRFVATAITSRRGLDDIDHFGVLLFDVKTPGYGADKFLYHYPTEGHLFFQAGISDDSGFLAFTEMPYTIDGGRNVHGRYRVHIIH